MGLPSWGKSGLAGRERQLIRRKDNWGHPENYDPHTGKYEGPSDPGRFHFRERSTGLKWGLMGYRHVASPVVYFPGDPTEYRLEAIRASKKPLPGGKRPFHLWIRKMRSPDETERVPGGPYNGVEAAQAAADVLIVSQQLGFEP
jgi:hypothetical protein